MLPTTMTADAIGAPEPIRIDIDCQRLELVQSGRNGNTGYSIYGETDSLGRGSSDSCPGGYIYSFVRGNYKAGEIVGYVSAVTGSITFIKRHD